MHQVGYLTTLRAGHRLDALGPAPARFEPGPHGRQITEFHYFDLEFADPANVALVQIIYPGRVQLMDLAPLSGAPVKVRFEIPLRAERMDQ